ncbi:MAG: YkgJ family cysteine cluster protein [Acidimicrobiia bacterium]
MTADGLPAPPFSEWLAGMRGALRGEHDADVPCGECTACCRASQFVPIEADETAVLAHIPDELRFPAPGRPPGTVVLGFDQHGACPMLTDAGCSIYDHRPRACRMYDCRIFAATGVAVEGPQQAEVARQVRRWRFAFPTAADHAAQMTLRHATDAVRASVLRRPAGTAAPGAIEVAVRAVDRPR